MSWADPLTSSYLINAIPITKVPLLVNTQTTNIGKRVEDLVTSHVRVTKSNRSPFQDVGETGVSTTAEWTSRRVHGRWAAAVAERGLTGESAA